MTELGEWPGSLLLPLRSPRGGLGFSKATSAYHSRWQKACLGCPQLIPKGWPMPCSARCSDDNRWYPWKQSKSPGQNVCPGSTREVEQRSAAATEARSGMCLRSQDLRKGKTWLQVGKAPPWETPSLTPFGFVSFRDNLISLTWVKGQARSWLHPASHPICHLPSPTTVLRRGCSTLAWKIPWTEEPGGLQSMGSLRVGHY